MNSELKYKKNNFSPENFPNTDYENQNDLNKDKKTNIKYLLKRIHDQRKRDRKKSISIGFAFLSIILIFSFVQN
jgi:hypothetical protein